ncbi:efflux RND transporter periplasmic adaptor subunit [Herminiimonas sp. CN]|uniref:efflux RND transporter periplasmic adaptor subunit n=1 Tax=Herminiimonas sp. CN TaxID=1349818 RepID=UPI000473902E|nr:efflux RND transporter periplasmic adaptor subunit [Herminiimonas sp. CN]
MIVAGIGWLIFQHGPMAPNRVTAATAEIADLQSSIFGIGIVEAQRSYAIGPTAASRVRRVLVDVGDTVQAGQLMAEMDPVDLNERATAAQSALQRARYAVQAAAAQVRDTEARHKVAASNAERYAELGKQAFLSSSAVEAKQQEAVSAQAGLLAAHAAQDGARQELGRLAAEQAAIGKQRSNLLLRAPVAGIVTARDAEPGTTLVAGQSVLRMMDPASIWIKARIDQARSGGLKTGLPASALLRSYPHNAFSGKIARIELNSDSVTEERLVSVTFDQIPTAITLGELAEITIAFPVTARALTIPNAALHTIDTRDGVWQLREGKLRFQPIRTGARALDGRVQVLSGLAKGDRVIVHSERELHEGDTVRIVDSLAKGNK